MNDWKWASDSGCCERIMACKSASMSSSCIVSECRSEVDQSGETHVEVDFIKVAVRMEDDVHIIETSDLLSE